MSSKENIKKFEDYEIEEFLMDEFFVRWVKNPEENTTHFWEKWLAANPQKRAVVTQAAELIRSIHYQPQVVLSDESYVELFENIIKADVETKTTDSSQPSKKGGWLSFFSVRHVAVFFLACLGAWVGYSALSKPPLDNQTAVHWITKTTPQGQKATIRLKDGTQIYLNSNTTLSYPENFTHTLRDVRLESGEAFFEVQKEDRPFIVAVSNTEVEVLGTSFNVNHRAGSHLEVALVEGSVKVKDTLGNQLMLAPSEMLELDQAGQLTKSAFDALEITGWKDKYLIFNNDEFSTVIQKLEDWYGVKIEVNGKFPKNWAYTGEYHDEILQNVLKGIQLTSNIKFKIDGKKVTISR
jgi:transmembrane sensor